VAVLIDHNTGLARNSRIKKRRKTKIDVNVAQAGVTSVPKFSSKGHG